MTQLSEFLKNSNTQGLSTRKISELAAKKGFEISNATVSRYLSGKHPEPPSLDVLKALGAVLGVPINKLEALSGMPASSAPFELPAKAATLNDAERAAILHLIDVMVANKTPPAPPGTVASQMSAIMQAHDQEAQARAQGLTPEDMAYHIGQPTPDGVPFRPDLYQDHLHLWEKYGADWYKNFWALAAKRRAEDLDDPYAGRSPFLGG